jgi:hypothetical protein
VKSQIAAIMSGSVNRKSMRMDTGEIASQMRKRGTEHLGMRWRECLGMRVAALSPCPNELGTHGAVDLPRSAAAGLSERSGAERSKRM